MTSYTVRPGDNLTKIARQFGVSVQDIVSANAIPNPNAISVGAVLSIPTNPDILSEFVPTQTRVPVTIDNATGAPMEEVIVSARRTPATTPSGFDLAEWLRPPKLYIGLAVVIGAALLLSSGGSRRYDD